MDPPAKVARRQGDLSARSNAPWHAAVESSLASRRQTHGCPASVDWQEMPAELVMAIGRAVPPHQRGNVRMVCRTWCRAVTDDVSCLQLPLSALAPPPRWHAMLLPPTQPPVWGWPRGPGRHSPAYREAHGLQGSPKGEGLEGREEQQVSDGGRKRQRGQGEVAEQGEAAAELGARDNSTIDGEEQEHQRQMEELRLLAARSPHLAAVRRLFMRFRSCRHVVLVHNTVLPPQDVQAALSALPLVCPGLTHAELRDSVSWEQPAELAPLLAGQGAGVGAAAAGPAGAVGAGGGAGAGCCGLTDLTVTYLSSPDMQRMTRRFSRVLERMVSPSWSVERLRVRWLMGEAPRAFFTSRGFTRWANTLAAAAPGSLGRLKTLDLAWAELSDAAFDPAPRDDYQPFHPLHPPPPLAPAGAAAAGNQLPPQAGGNTLAPAMPPWELAPYVAAHQPHGAAAAAAAVDDPVAAAGGWPLPQQPNNNNNQQQPQNAAFAAFQAALHAQQMEEEATPGAGAGHARDGWNELGSAAEGQLPGLQGVAGAPRPGLPLALSAFSNLTSVSLCCMASRAPADHVLRLLLRCRRLTKLSLVHHEAFTAWPSRRVAPRLTEALAAVVREELGTGGDAAPDASTAPADPSSSSCASSSPSWWPAGLSLPLRELHLPCTPALLMLLHLPAPALANLKVLDLQMILAGYATGRPLAGTGRLVAALQAAAASGARLRDLFLNNVDLAPPLMDVVAATDSLEQLMVFGGMIVTDDDPGGDAGGDFMPFGGGGLDSDSEDSDDDDEEGQEEDGNGQEGGGAGGAEDLIDLVGGGDDLDIDMLLAGPEPAWVQPLPAMPPWAQLPGAVPVPAMPGALPVIALGQALNMQQQQQQQQQQQEQVGLPGGDVQGGGVDGAAGGAGGLVGLVQNLVGAVGQPQGQGQGQQAGEDEEGGAPEEAQGQAEPAHGLAEPAGEHVGQEQVVQQQQQDQQQQQQQQQVGAVSLPPQDQPSAPPQQPEQQDQQAQGEQQGGQHRERQGAAQREGRAEQQQGEDAAMPQQQGKQGGASLLTPLQQQEEGIAGEVPAQQGHGETQQGQACQATGSGHQAGSTQVGAAGCPLPYLGGSDGSTRSSDGRSNGTGGNNGDGSGRGADRDHSEDPSATDIGPTAAPQNQAASIEFAEAMQLHTVQPPAAADGEAAEAAAGAASTGAMVEAAGAAAGAVGDAPALASANGPIDAAAAAAPGAGPPAAAAAAAVAGAPGPAAAAVAAAGPAPVGQGPAAGGGGGGGGGGGSSGGGLGALSDTLRVLEGYLREMLQALPGLGPAALLELLAECLLRGAKAPAPAGGAATAAATAAAATSTQQQQQQQTLDTDTATILTAIATGTAAAAVALLSCSPSRALEGVDIHDLLSVGWLSVMLRYKEYSTKREPTKGEPTKGEPAKGEPASGWGSAGGAGGNGGSGSGGGGGNGSGGRSEFSSWVEQAAALVRERSERDGVAVGARDPLGKGRAAPGRPKLRDLRGGGPEGRMRLQRKREECREAEERQASTTDVRRLLQAIVGGLYGVGGAGAGGGGGGSGGAAAGAGGLQFHGFGSTADLDGVLSRVLVGLPIALNLLSNVCGKYGHVEEDGEQEEHAGRDGGEGKAGAGVAGVPGAAAVDAAVGGAEGAGASRHGEERRGPEGAGAADAGGSSAAARETASGRLDATTEKGGHSGSGGDGKGGLFECRREELYRARRSSMSSSGSSDSSSSSSSSAEGSGGGGGYGSDMDDSESDDGIEFSPGLYRSHKGEQRHQHQQQGAGCGMAAGGGGSDGPRGSLQSSNSAAAVAGTALACAVASFGSVLAAVSRAISHAAASGGGGGGEGKGGEEKDEDERVLVVRSTARTALRMLRDTRGLIHRQRERLAAAQRRLVAAALAEAEAGGAAGSGGGGGGGSCAAAAEAADAWARIESVLELLTLAAEAAVQITYGSGADASDGDDGAGPSTSTAPQPRRRRAPPPPPASAAARQLAAAVVSGAVEPEAAVEAAYAAGRRSAIGPSAASLTRSRANASAGGGGVVASMRSLADEATMASLHLTGLTRLTRLRRLCLDLSTDNTRALPVASAVRYLLRNLPSLESAHITDQCPHSDNRPLGTLGPIADPSSSLTSPVPYHTCAHLTSLTIASRPLRRATVPCVADSHGRMLPPAAAGQGGGAGHGAGADPWDMGFGGLGLNLGLAMGLDVAAHAEHFSNTAPARCATDLSVHVDALPRNLLALCLHRVRLVGDPPLHDQDLQDHHLQRPQLPPARKPHTGTTHPPPPTHPPPAAAACPGLTAPTLPPLLQHLWLSNVTLTGPMDLAALFRGLLAAAPASGGLQTLVLRHCFVSRQHAHTVHHSNNSCGSAAISDGCVKVTAASKCRAALRVLNAAVGAIAQVGQGGGNGNGMMLMQQLGMAGGGGGVAALADGWAVGEVAGAAGSVMAAAVENAAAACGVVRGCCGRAVGPTRLVLGTEELELLGQMKTLRTLGLDGCLRLEDMGSLCGLTALRVLALCPNAVACEEARARLSVEMSAGLCPSLQAAIMRLAPLTGLRSLWLPEWAGGRSALLQWQAQLAAAGPPLVTLRVMDHDNVWRLPAPAGCPDVEDSLQWWQAEVWNTI